MISKWDSQIPIHEAKQRQKYCWTMKDGLYISLQKDRIYQNIYGWFCGKLKLSSREREILSNRECGIDAYIEQKPCVREEEIKRYFYRLGIQLFICYLSGTSDLHRENIIADGEYPELIDLETMPGAGKDSVMETGMLPVSCWGNTPIGLPVISNPKTSNIKLDYRQREVSAQDNILLCNGRWMAEEICIGFEDAYRTALGEREAINMLYIGRKADIYFAIRSSIVCIWRRPFRRIL